VGVLGGKDAAVHKQHAIDLFTFFMEDNKEILQLNMNTSSYTCVIGLPNSVKVQVLHCIGIGTTAIGHMPSKIDGKLLFFHGDGVQDIGSPLPIVLPQSILTKTDV
jgi:hypothetical protein